MMAPNRLGSSQTTKGDSWMVNGMGRTIIRRHAGGQRSLFTPLNVNNGPKAWQEVGSIRTTIGRYESGGKFMKTDMWKDSTNANRQLRSRWSGITVFSDKPLSEQTVSDLRIAAESGKKTVA